MSVTSGSRLAIAALVKTWRTSLRSSSCSGGSIRINILSLVEPVAHRQCVQGDAVGAAECLPVAVGGNDILIAGQA